MKRSIFFKLLLVILTVGVLVNVLFFTVVRHVLRPPRTNRSVIDRAIELYTSKAAQELGPAPTRARVDEIAAEVGLSIRVEGPGGVVTSDSALPSWDDYQAAVRRDPSPPSSGPFHSPGPPGYFPLQIGGTHYLFYLPKHSQVEEHTELIVLSLIGMTGLFILSYLVLRRLLQPVRLLMEGVSALGSGSLDHRVPVRGNDELTELARSFNEMAGRVRAMVETKQQLLIDVSHELRSPIARMKLTVELLPEGKNRGRLFSNLGELERMVSDLLEAARLEKGLTLAPFDLRELVDECQRIYAEQAPDLDVDRGAALVIQGDLDRLRSVLRNVVENAIKYSSAAPRPIEIRLQRDAAGALLTVRDYGIGIPPDEMERVFEPFYRVDKSRSKSSGGYGLGLSLCRKIMAAHGGVIELTSEVGQGTIVTLRFPTLPDA